MTTASHSNREATMTPGVILQAGRIDPQLVQGWAIDADPDNDPTYPMKVRIEGEHASHRWERPTQQPVDVEILHSNERPSVSAVFGESTPPAALSGIIRRVAFRYSESSYAHWLPLMLADRVNMIEGLVDDLSGGHVPNIPAELGWGAEWRHNRGNLVSRIVVSAVVVTAAIGVVTALRRRRAG